MKKVRDYVYNGDAYWLFVEHKINRAYKEEDGGKMDFVRLYYDSRDINPSALLVIFLRCLGLYVVEVVSGQEEIAPGEALANIHIISDNYMNSFDVHDMDMDADIEAGRLLWILKDGWAAEDEAIPNVLWLDDTDYQNVLEHVLKHLIKNARQNHVESILENFPLDNVEKLVNALLEYDVLQVVYTARYFFENQMIIKWALEKYKDFLSTISGLIETGGDLLEFMHANICYHIDLLCRFSNMPSPYMEGTLLDRCESLIYKYGHQNVALHILVGDIYEGLLDQWIEAYGAFDLSLMPYNSYAYYRIGRIILRRERNSTKARGYFQRAAKINPKYYKAWYQVARCYESEMHYEEAIAAFQKVPDVLLRDGEEYLQPIEREYIYKSYIKIANISENRMQSKVNAYLYFENAAGQADIRWSGYLTRFPWEDTVLQAAIVEEMNMRQESKVVPGYAQKRMELLREQIESAY